MRIPAKIIYLAAPLFSESEQNFNYNVCNELEKIKFKVFLPQRDGFLYSNLLKQGVSPETAQQKIFASDMIALEACDAVVAILDGRTIDEGVAFEMGVAFSLKKFILGLQTDARRLLPTGNNPMIEASLSCAAPDIQSMIHALQLWRSISRADV